MPDEKKPDDSLDENLKPEDQSAVDDAASEPSGESGVDDASNDAASEPSDDSGVDGASNDAASESAKVENDSSVAVDERPEGEAVDGNEPSPDDPDKVVNADDASEDDAEAAMMKMLEEEVESASESSPGGDDFPDLSGIKMEPTANPAEFQQLTPTPGAEGTHKNIDMLLDVKMPISIELGRTEMAISELLTLGPGSVVELNKLAGEPVDLLVNDKIIARGEVVVVDENFGVRITLLMSPEERLKSLAQA